MSERIVEAAKKYVGPRGYLEAVLDTPIGKKSFVFPKVRKFIGGNNYQGGQGDIGKVDYVVGDVKPGETVIVYRTSSRLIPNK